MKKIIFALLVLIPQFCFADMVVIYDKETKEIFTVSEKDDTFIPENCEKKIIKGNLSDFTDENPINYKFSNGKFVKNIEKISRDEQKRIENEEKAKEEALVQKKIRQQAIDALKSEGKKLKYITE